MKKVFDKIKTIGIEDMSLFDSLSLSLSNCHEKEYFVFPGFCDVHVHFREPGFSYKETILSGSEAAAHGGYTAVCTMPNLKPVPDSRENLDKVLEPIKKNALIDVIPFGAITVGQMGEKTAEIELMAEDVAGFSDDGHGVQSREMMKDAMMRAKKLGKIISAHCEDNSLLKGGYIHAGKYAAEHGHRGIVSESEWGPIKRDIELLRETGASYHVCHISCKESVDLIRKAKSEGLDITCETAPHYLLLDENDLREDGAFKMNPPLRSEEDRVALIEGIKDGTIDIIATDHAPHSSDEKSRGLEKSAFGIVGIETAFPLLYTGLVKKGIITLEKLIELISLNPRKRFGLDEETGYTVWDLDDEYEIDPNDFKSMGRSTPFAGVKVSGRCIMTSLRGKTVYKY